MPSVSLTELRQNLFALADRVAETGEPLVIERRGVRLELVRISAPAMPGRLARLEARDLVIGEPLLPEESPAVWSAVASTSRVAAEPSAPTYGKQRKPRRPRSR
jgi:antitoxin (DNA-binding transcriptional repressor) of toxin-antitoxin stability system